MSNLDHLQVQRYSPSIPLETNLARRGFYSLRGGADAQIPFERRDLYGSLSGSNHLRLLDAEILGWLCGRMSTDGARARFSRHQLAVDLFGAAPGGREKRMIAASFARLTDTRLSFELAEARGARTYRKGRKPLKEASVLDRLEQVSGGRVGRGQLWDAVPSPWLLNQLAYGYVTFLDWSTLRSLRGLAKRLWILLETQDVRQRVPFSAKPDQFGGWIALTDKGMSTLGIGYRRQRDATAAVVDATERILKVDTHYEFELARWGSSHRLIFKRYRSWNTWMNPEPTGAQRADEPLVGCMDRPWQRGKQAESRIYWSQQQSSRTRGHVKIVTLPMTDSAQPSSDFSVAALRVVGRVDTAHHVSCEHFVSGYRRPEAQGEAVFGRYLAEVDRWFDLQRIPRPKICTRCKRYPKMLSQDEIDARRPPPQSKAVSEPF